jgi:hypothetical protein
MGCNFCTTSSFFGGKGKFHNFYETGDELFDIMEGFENTMKVQTFFVMDENVRLHRARHAVAGTDESREKKLGPGGVRIGKRDSQVLHAGTR